MIENSALMALQKRREILGGCDRERADVASKIESTSGRLRISTTW